MFGTQAIALGFAMTPMHIYSHLMKMSLQDSFSAPFTVIVFSFFLISFPISDIEKCDRIDETPLREHEYHEFERISPRNMFLIFLLACIDDGGQKKKERNASGHSITISPVLRLSLSQWILYFTTFLLYVLSLPTHLHLQYNTPTSFFATIVSC